MYSSIEDYFKAHLDKGCGFMLALGSPLPDGTVTAYLHPMDGEGDTINCAIVEGKVVPILEKPNGDLEVHDTFVPSGTKLVIDEETKEMRVLKFEVDESVKEEVIK